MVGMLTNFDPLRPDPESVLATARASLECYAIAVFPSFESAAHHRLTIQKLEAVEAGEIRRLIITEPPRHGKSLLTCQIFPCWFLGRHPDRSVICATYGQDLSDDFGRRVRNLLADPLHRAIFPGCRLSNDSASQRRFDLIPGGSYFAVGRGDAITGRGANLMVIDDPLKDREEAYSETIRRKLHDWFGSVAYTRLAPDAGVVVVSTRWHEDDVVGWLLREHGDEGWELLNLPAIAESDEGFRKAGEALWPERFPLSRLEQIRQAVGGAAWAALYQQRPSAAEGAVFRREWWRTYGEAPGSFKRIVQSWDTAFRSGAENDYSVCTTWGTTDTGYYLLALWRDRVEFPDLKRKLVALAEAWNPNAVLVEDKASGQSLVQEIQHDTALPIIPVKIDTDKVARAQAVTPLVESGRVFLPAGAAWLSDYVDELASFPRAVHDDMVDSTTQALNYLREEPCVYGYIEF
jgi:predicted phage terminase large subunit-like protein